MLPERWRYIQQDEGKVRAVQNERGKDYQFIKNLAELYNVNIIFGGIWEQRNENSDDKSKPYITAYFIDENGNEIGRQDKLHLYSYESTFFQPGKSLNIFHQL